VVSNTPGYAGNPLDFFSAGNPGILLEFCQVCWKFNGAVAFVVIDMMRLMDVDAIFPVTS